jgi:Meiotically Up-regulated Gene 113 (MUG113) protein
MGKTATTFAPINDDGTMNIKFLGRDIDRHGKQRWYVRAGEGRRRKIRCPAPGTPGFLKAYEAAVAALALKNELAGAIGRTEGFVYFLLYGNGNNAKVKIGTSKNVNARLASLKTGVPGKVRVYYVTPANIALERELHDRFAEDRVSGEWFRFSQAIRDWINQDRDRRAIERGWRAAGRPADSLGNPPRGPNLFGEGLP